MEKKKRSADNILSKKKEGYVKMMGVRGFGKTKDELLTVAKNYLDLKERKAVWEDNKPSDRHSEIALSKS